MVELIGTLGKRSVLTGDDGDVVNTLYGDTDGSLPQDEVSKGGNDVLTGGAGGRNELYGDAGIMRDNARGGDDTLTGGANSSNELYGDAFEMSDDARGGDVRLVSGTGDDQMWGDAARMLDNAVGGRDVFAFLFDENGNDTIGDFEQGKDKIEIGGATGGFAGLDIDETGGDSIIDMGDDNSITVKFVTGLTADDFLFVA